MSNKTKLALGVILLVAVGWLLRDVPDPIADHTVPTTFTSISVPTLEEQVELELRVCQSESADGWVTNSSASTVDVFVEVQFLDVNGDIIEDSNDWVRGLRPGERGRWSAPWLGDGIYRSCRAEIGGVFDQ